MMITAQHLHKIYKEGSREVAVLNGLDFSVSASKKIGIIGASGVGKSTLLHVLGGLDSPTAGAVFVEEKNLYGMSEEARSKLRNRFFGFIFQFYHLLPELTALENVMLPGLIAGFSKSQSQKSGLEALSQVGLKERGTHRPAQLSGGEQQRVALARACILKPKLILADEPTGNLDQKTGEEVLKFLFEVVDLSGGSLVLVTHNPELVKNLDEVFELKNGKLSKI